MATSRRHPLWKIHSVCKMTLDIFCVMMYTIHRKIPNNLEVHYEKN